MSSSLAKYIYRLLPLEQHHKIEKEKENTNCGKSAQNHFDNIWQKRLLLGNSKNNF
jgi:hypothetical protein